MKLPKLSLSTGEYVVPEPGSYTMELASYTDPEPSSFDPDKLRFSMTFRIVDDADFEGVEVRQFYGWSMHASSKLFPVIRALRGGAEIDEDDEIDLDELIGRKVVGMVEVVEKPRRDNPAEMARFANVVGVSPLRRKKEAAPAGATNGKRKPAWEDDEDAA